jgi:hypothetical protein
MDTRILKISDNSFIITFNLWVTETDKCKNGCMIMETRKMIMIDENTISLEDSVAMCPSISKTIEKNWSLWKYKDKLNFSYNLHPYHEVYNFNLDTMKCNSILEIL